MHFEIYNIFDGMFYTHLLVACLLLVQQIFVLWLIFVKFQYLKYL